MLSKAYVEITNVCNLQCSFCHGTKRTPRRMTEEEFSLVMSRLRGHTRYVYFHLMGEPLTHPLLPDFLRIAADAGMSCCLTTNGFLLEKCRETLLSAEKLYKISVSLHSFEANTAAVSLEDYLDSVLRVIEPLAEKGTICALRLWNDGGENALNDAILERIHAEFPGEWERNRMGSRRLRRNIYLENAAKFDWPDVNAPEQPVRFCLGLRDQLGILSDGTVVPCCLDADGSIPLGNIYTQELPDILNTPRARAIYDGFSRHKPPEELCRRCGFATRFNQP